MANSQPESHVVRFLSILIVALLLGCSTGTPQQTRKDAVMSGEETAEKAANAARTADENDNTGVLVHSSRAEEAPDEAEETDPPAAPSVLRIELRRGSVTMNGEPIPEAKFGEVVEEAVAANPDVLVVFVRDTMTGPEATERFMDQAREAGARRVEERPAL